LNWTEQQQAQAREQGWHVEGRQIKKTDDPAYFESDRDARVYVEEMAAMGDLLCTAAIDAIT
jgi:hypothetical protein